MSFDLVVRIAALDPRDLEVPRKPQPAAKKKVDLWFGGAASAWPDEAFAPPADTGDDDARATRFRAKYHARDTTLRRTVSLRAMQALLDALASAGAIYEASAALHAGPYGDGDRGPRGPLREVPSYKLGSNDGWHVTRDEADVLATRLTSALDGGLESDPSRATWLRDLASFFRAGAERHGFEVW